MEWTKNITQDRIFFQTWMMMGDDCETNCLLNTWQVWRFSGAVQRNYPQFTESCAIIFPYFSHLRISIEVSQVIPIPGIDLQPLN
jgi:hypothetical protein